jgi:membrane protein implicated in regulation of membrane protease activity
MLSSLGSFLFAWFNTPFTVLLGISVLLALLQLIGLGGGDHDSDADADASVAVDHDLDLDHSIDLEHGLDVDHSVDVDHDIDLQHDLDVDHGADLDHSADVEHGASLQHDVVIDHDAAVDHGAGAGHDGQPGTLALLAYLGVGKVPLTVLLILLTGAIGLLGWILNSLVQTVFGGYPGIFFAAVLPVSLVVSGVVTARVARIIGNALPPISTTATRSEALVGIQGTVISPFVDTRYGMVHVRDRGGTLISVFATCEGEPIRRGEKVVLVRYDPAARTYVVTKAPAWSEATDF